MRGVPRAKLSENFFPRTSRNFEGGKPPDGLKVATLLSVTRSPALTSRVIHREGLRFREIASESATNNSRDPSDASASVMPLTSAFSASGPTENASSGPPLSESRVTCFSIRFAPSTAAAIAGPIPSVWSEKPTLVFFHGGLNFKKSRNLRLSKQFFSSNPSCR